jgi:hypothetical protein
MSSSEQISSVDSMTYGIPTSIVVFLIVFMIFQWEFTMPSFRILLYVGIPALIYLITAVVTLLAQYSGCSTIRIKDVFLYSVPSAVFSYIALFISFFSFCRIPVGSVIAPLFISTPPPDPSNPASCCAQKITLESVEKNQPMVKGFSHGFYLFFSTLFGLLVSIGFTSVCNP